MLQTTCIVKTFLVLNPLAALGSDNQQYSWLSRLSAAIGVQCEVYPDRTHKGLGLASLIYSSNNYSTFKIERWVMAQFSQLQCSSTTANSISTMDSLKTDSNLMMVAWIWRCWSTIDPVKRLQTMDQIVIFSNGSTVLTFYLLAKKQIWRFCCQLPYLICHVDMIFCRQWPCLFCNVDFDFCNLTVCCSFNVIWQGQKIAQKFFHIFCPLQFLGTNWRIGATEKPNKNVFLINSRC